ncbi:BQ5605_C012g06879 [Microbotryum silenes-dioicae]|uniref:BQ5605_C012g06879 protein n=1 Tax=Microbotryum silenes-dioicae TaxID=796604 RepID=A0A2X0MLT4_9BASI|nr:BQ5605_C012g06879 [Microbotryum silenes-dioicae]
MLCRMGPNNVSPSHRVTFLLLLVHSGLVVVIVTTSFLPCDPCETSCLCNE